MKGYSKNIVFVLGGYAWMLEIKTIQVKRLLSQ
jgi:hypothetical protein